MLLRVQEYQSGRVEDSVLERKELHAKKTVKICRESPPSMQQSTDQCMCVRKLPEAKERITQKDYNGIY